MSFLKSKHYLGWVNWFLGEKPVQILLILFVAFIFRVSGYNWGGGLLIHPDEQFITEPAYWMELKQNSDPGNYMRPAHWSINIHHFVYKITSNILFDNPLREIYPSYRLFFTYISRTITAIWGTLLILVIFHIGQHLQKGMGWFAAGFATVFTSYVIHSHFVTPDIPLSLLSALAMLLSIQYFKTGSVIYFILLMVNLAWCIGEKYPGLLFALSVGTHLFFIKPSNEIAFIDNRWIRVILLTIGTIFFLFLSTPYLILNFDKVLVSFSNESRSVHLGADGLGWNGNLWFYLKGFFDFSGIIFLCFIGIGIFKSASLNRNHIIVLMYPLIFILLISKVSLHWERWAVPFYILPICLGSLGMYHIANRIFTTTQRLFIYLAIYVPFIYAGIQSLEKITYYLAKTNTLKIAKAYCKVNNITPTNTIYGSYTPFAPNGRFDFDFAKSFQDSSYKQNKRFAIISSGFYGLIFDYGDSTSGEYVFYKRFMHQKTLAIFKPQIPTQIINGEASLFEFGKIIHSTIFLKSIWIDKKKYIPGDEICIYKL